jgi:hypothetical protein
MLFLPLNYFNINVRDELIVLLTTTFASTLSSSGLPTPPINYSSSNSSKAALNSLNACASLAFFDASIPF